MPAIDRTVPIDGAVVRILSTDRNDGDFAVAVATTDEGERIRAAIHPAPWTWLRQIHGRDVVEVDAAGDHAGAVADGVLTSAVDAPIAVTTADCAPLVLVGDRAVAVVHAGWRGAVAGVVESAATAMAAIGVQPVEAILGPCIHPARYAFGVDDLDAVVARFGPSVATTTVDGAPALDMPEVVASACRESGWPVPSPGPCTSHSSYFSHRTRGDSGRLTTVAWIEPCTPK